MTIPAAGGGGASGGPGSAPGTSTPQMSAFLHLPDSSILEILAYIPGEELGAVACTTGDFRHVVRQISVLPEVKIVRVFTELVSKKLPETMESVKCALVGLGLHPVAHTKMGYYREVNAALDKILSELPKETVLLLLKDLKDSDIPGRFQVLLKFNTFYESPSPVDHYDIPLTLTRI